MRPPVYYDNLLSIEDGENYDYIKYQREIKANAYQAEQTYERLQIKEKVKKAQIKKLIRGL